MNQALGAFGLLEFTMYGPFSLGAGFETYEVLIFLVLNLFSDRGKLRILNQWIRGHDCVLQFEFGNIRGRNWFTSETASSAEIRNIYVTSRNSRTYVVWL
jgi:hypothetical protein